MAQTKEKSEYDLQAEKFLELTGLRIEKHYLYHGPYFEDDKDNRAVFEIVFIRAGRAPWTFKFGNSVSESWSLYRDFKKLSARDPLWQSKLVVGWLKANGGQDGFGLRLSTCTASPSDYSILACITKYDPGTFADFCADYGYEVDSRKAEKVYFSVQDEWSNVRQLFTNEELEKLQEIN
jgi:hypothetical protein